MAHYKWSYYTVHTWPDRLPLLTDEILSLSDALQFRRWERCRLDPCSGGSSYCSARLGITGRLLLLTHTRLLLTQTDLTLWTSYNHKITNKILFSLLSKVSKSAVKSLKSACFKNFYCTWRKIHIDRSNGSSCSCWSISDSKYHLLVNGTLQYLPRVIVQA